MNESPADREAPVKGRVQTIVASAIVIAVLVVLFEPTGVIRGRILGESFFGGRPSSYWAAKLQAGPAERAEARQRLEQGGPAGAPVLIELLQSGASAELRWTAAEILGTLGPDAYDAADALLGALQDADPYVQSVAAEVIPKVGVPADEAVPALVPLLAGEHAPVAARAISYYKSQAAPAIGELLAVLTDTSRTADARWNAARAIGKIGPPAIEALPTLIEMARDHEATVRGNAAEAIGDIGPTASAGIPALIEALGDSADAVRHHAVRSLRYIGPAATVAVPSIMPLLQDPVPKVREEAEKALRALAPDEHVDNDHPIGVPSSG